MSQTDVTRVDSVEEQDPHNLKDNKKPKSKKPANTAFRQQRLKAWQPILTPKTVLPFFFTVGIIFAPIGGVLLWASSQVQELVIDYTNCHTEAPLTSSPIPSDYVQSDFKTTSQESKAFWWREDNVRGRVSHGSDVNTTRCSLQFSLPEDFTPPVFLYYRLTNFYQNHRRYVNSLDLEQLQGTAVSTSTMKNSQCKPLNVDPHTNKPYYPCGLIANSIFNDTISEPMKLGVNGNNQNETYSMTSKGIAWSSDKEVYKKTKYRPDQVVPPPNWVKRYPNGSYTDEYPPPNVEEYEEYQVWMRTAGLPTFSKLSRRNDHTIMRSGDYQIDIDYFFPVTDYGGTKSLVLTTTTVMGGKNPFMGIAYVAVGGICILFGAVFTLAHLIKPRKLGDHTYLSWNNEQPSTAVSTGREGFGSA